MRKQVYRFTIFFNIDCKDTTFLRSGKIYFLPGIKKQAAAGESLRQPAIFTLVCLTAR